MTDEDGATQWLVRPGTMLDVNPVGRLLQASAQAPDLAWEAPPGPPADLEAAGVAARLLLLHVVLERGRLIVAEHNGHIVGASVWLPGDAPFASDDMPSLLRRELHLSGDSEVADAIGPPAAARAEFDRSMRDLATTLAQSDPDLVLYAVVIDAEHARTDLVPHARLLVAPVLREGVTVRALALDAARARLLEAIGFAEQVQVPLGEQGSVWVGVPEAAPSILA